MKRNQLTHINFPGFAQVYDHNIDTDPWLMYPLILEEFWYALTGAEHKVLIFILRQTIGWRNKNRPEERKTHDQIAWSQFANGVGGKSKGRGTGLSVSQIRTAAKGLEEKGFITITRRKSSPCTFHLVMRKTAVDIANEKNETALREHIKEHNERLRNNSLPN